MIYKLLAYSIVWPLQALTPLCFAVFPAVSLDVINRSKRGDEGVGGVGWLRVVLLGYTGAEVLFYGWFRYALRRSQVICVL
jgi:hypothetical protein